MGVHEFTHGQIIMKLFFFSILAAGSSFSFHKKYTKYTKKYTE